MRSGDDTILRVGPTAAPVSMSVRVGELVELELGCGLCGEPWQRTIVAASPDDDLDAFVDELSRLASRLLVVRGALLCPSCQHVGVCPSAA